MSSILCQWKFDEGEGDFAIERISGERIAIEYVFNRARFKPSSSPIWKKGISGTALLFDGYSTFLRGPKARLSLGSSFTVEAWVAPRALEHGFGGKLSAIVNQYDPSANAGFILGIGRHGHWALRFGDGCRFLELWDGDHPLPREQWSHVAARVDADAGRAGLYFNGLCISEIGIPADFQFMPADADMLIGRTADNEQLLGIFNMNMFNGLMDMVAIHGEALPAEEIRQNFRNVLQDYGGSIPLIEASDIRLDPALYEGDPYRPRFHAIVPGHWMNEPHAPFYFNGKYHLFCQHNPFGPFFYELRWGHWVSDDLVNWRFLGEAITQDARIAPDGVWSGSASYDENGVPVLFFTAANKARCPDQAIAMARPENADDPLLERWIKHPNLLLEQDPALGLSADFRDPFVWHDTESALWYMLVGSSRGGEIGCAQIYASDNLADWRHLGDFYRYDDKKYPYIGPIWELPVFLPIGHYPNAEQRYIFLISPVGKGADVEIFYWLGRFDKERHQFVADFDEPRLIDFGDFHFTGPSGMIDPRTGRLLLFTIAQGERSPQDEHDAGWAHNAGLPVVLSLDEAGGLLVDPIEELSSLRAGQLIGMRDQNWAAVNQSLAMVSSRMLEIIVEIEPLNSKAFGLKVGVSRDGNEQTLIGYDTEKSRIWVDRTRTCRSRDYGINGGPLDLKGDNLKLHVFIDHSMLEIYANSRQSITTRIYSEADDACGVEIWCDGDVKIKNIEIWKVKAIDV
ncbi:GH32 C-terminal domain-containing protein [Sphingomonas oleivorans]|nr:GH32 C-terminal domain-containing protein [Sphingomonas oleivorans]